MFNIFGHFCRIPPPPHSFCVLTPAPKSDAMISLPAFAARTEKGNQWRKKASLLIIQRTWVGTKKKRGVSGENSVGLCGE